MMNLDDPRHIAITKLFTGDTGYEIPVLRWLAEDTGFLVSLPPGATLEQLIDHNATRRLFGVVFEILSATPEGREALATAFSPATPQQD